MIESRGGAAKPVSLMNLHTLASLAALVGLSPSCASFQDVSPPALAQGGEAAAPLDRPELDDRQLDPPGAGDALVGSSAAESRRGGGGSSAAEPAFHSADSRSGQSNSATSPEIRLYYASSRLDDDLGVLDLLELDRTQGFGVQVSKPIEAPLSLLAGFELGAADSSVTSAEIDYRALYGGIEASTSSEPFRAFVQVGLMLLNGDLTGAGAANGDDSATGLFAAFGATWLPPEGNLGAFVAFRPLAPDLEAFGEKIESSTLQIGLSFRR